MENQSLNEDFIRDYISDKEPANASDGTEKNVEPFADLAPDKAAEAFLETTGKDPSKSNEQKLQEGLNLVQRLQNTSAGIEASYAYYVIQMGKMLVWMKQEIKAMGEKWGPWAKENLPFLGERVRQQYLQLAKRPDAHRYGYLGKERLLRLIRFTKDSEAKDPIGDLLVQNDLRFDPQGGIPLIEFGAQVDSALSSAKGREDGERSIAQRKIAIFAKQLDALERTGNWFMRHRECLSSEILSMIESTEDVLEDLKITVSKANTQEKMAV